MRLIFLNSHIYTGTNDIACHGRCVWDISHLIINCNRLSWAHLLYTEWFSPNGFMILRTCLKLLKQLRMTNITFIEESFYNIFSSDSSLQANRIWNNCHSNWTYTTKGKTYFFLQNKNGKWNAIYMLISLCHDTV